MVCSAFSYRLVLNMQLELRDGMRPMGRSVLPCFSGQVSKKAKISAAAACSMNADVKAGMLILDVMTEAPSGADALTIHFSVLRAFCVMHSWCNNFVLIQGMNKIAIAGGVIVVDRMVEHKTAASGSCGVAAAAVGVVRPGQSEENSRDYRWEGQRIRQRCSVGSNVVGSVSGLVAPAEMEQMTAASSSESSSSSKIAFQMTYWSENSDTIAFVKRCGQPSIPSIKLKTPIESWEDGRLRTVLRGMFSDWRRAQGLLPAAI